jgi:hypothetical protein
MKKQERKASKRWKPHGLNDPKTRESFLSDFNQSTLDPGGPVGAKNEMRILKELNSFVDEHER